jgi:ubiquinone/menaquinone biosynthesis C-methylase UbiE
MEEYIMEHYYGTFKYLNNHYSEKLEECPLYYEKAAELYEQMQIAYDDYDLFREQAFMYGSPVLELCCGSGRLTLPLARAGLKITAVDLSQDMLDSMETQLSRKYRKIEKNIERICGDMTKLSLDKKFNFIMIGATSIRLMENDFTEFFNQMYKLLNPGGCFYFNYEDMPILQDKGVVREPVATFAYDDRRGEMSLITTQRIISYPEKRATVNFLRYKPCSDEKMLLSHTDYRIFGTKDIQEAAEKSLFGMCEIEPTMSHYLFCKMVKK